MTATPSIDLPAWMVEQLSQASPDLLRQMVQTFAEALMSAEADAVCGAEYGQRSPDRRNTRNGYRHPGVGHPRRQHRPGHPQATGIESTSRSGCSSGVGGPSPPWSAWWRPPICSGCPRGGWSAGTTEPRDPAPHRRRRMSSPTGQR